MKIDVEYIKEFLDIILDHNHPDFDIHHEKIRPLWGDNDEALSKLVFHMEILKDQGLIENSSGSPSIGFKRGGDFIISVIPLRLTANGHQFISDLTKPGVIEVIKTSFKDIGPTEIVKIALSLGEKMLEKKLEKIV